MKYCQRCVFPVRAVNSIPDLEGVCSACRAAEKISIVADSLFWNKRQELFENLIEQYRNQDGSNYDCLVPVSGGKDSYWLAYLMKYEYGMNPLLVTYHGNNYLPEGQANLDRMRDRLGIDHVIFGPNVETLKKLNRIGFKKMGDMNWHAQAGIKITPVRAAVQFNIPLMIWGEIAWTVAQTLSVDEYVQYDKRTVIDHDLRGFSWTDMVGGEEGLEARDLIWLRFPSDEAIKNVGVQGVYGGNFFKWDSNEHALLMQDKFNFEFAREPFERTYRNSSGLDDMHENGIHDYMNFIKFGYARASEHASKDIRDGYITRGEALQIVQRYDHVKPQRDLDRWLRYVSMTEKEFDEIADTFRSPRVWWIENGRWYKDNVWGESSCYGDVHFSEELDVSKYARQDAA